MLQPEEVTKNGGSGGSHRRKEAEERRELLRRIPATAKEAAAPCGDQSDRQQPRWSPGWSSHAGERAPEERRLRGCQHQCAHKSCWEQGADLLLSLSLSRLSSGYAGDREGSQVPFRGRTESRAGSPSHPHPYRGVTPGGYGDTHSDAKAERAPASAVLWKRLAARWVCLSCMALELGSFPSSCPTSPGQGGGSQGCALTTHLFRPLGSQ